jgi:hypothetical protein
MRFPDRSERNPTGRCWEGRFAVALVALFSLGTVSVLATTSALSRDHAVRLATAIAPLTNR